jgi:hypothetical protein
MLSNSNVPTLHITNGDSAAGTLREFISDPVVVTCDVLHEGPAPLTASIEEWYDARAAFIASRDYDAAGVKRSLSAMDTAIADGRYDEVLLWFEHDLFDQLLLIRALDLLNANNHVRRVSLICIGSFPGVDRFIGLGQLNAAQLATLVALRQRVTTEQYELASRAWRAFREPDPTGLLRLRADHTGALPFLGDALQRLFAEYPSKANGLPRTGQLIVEALADGPTTGGKLFRATQIHEPRPFLGDWSFFAEVRRLAGGRVPLLTIDGPLDTLDLRHHIVAATEAGRDVLAERDDAVRLNGIDLWRGGVHLAGEEAQWRWDPRAETLV